MRPVPNVADPVNHRRSGYWRFRAALAVAFVIAGIHAGDALGDTCTRTRGVQNIPGLLLWFSSENLPQVSDGTAVERWGDCSGNEFDAVQASLSRQPVLRVDGIAGYPVLEFDGIDDVLKLTGNALLHDISLFIVYRYQASVVPDCQRTFPFNLGGDVDVTGQYWGIETLNPCGGNSVDVADIYAGFSNDARATLPGISAAGIVNQLTAISSGFIHNTQVFVNSQAAAMMGTGVSVPLDVPLSGNPEASWNGIGGGTFPNDNKAAQVQIAEVILFETALTTAERWRVERYLQSKYLGGDE